MAIKETKVFSNNKGNLKQIEKAHREYYKDADRKSTDYESGPAYRSKAVEELTADGMQQPSQEDKEVSARVKGNLLANEDAKKYQPKFKSGGKVSSASKRADGCAVRGKTRA